MYISTNPGLGARGLRGLGALNCPGDPGCPGNIGVVDMPAPVRCCADAAAAAAGGCDDSCIGGSTADQAILQMQQQIYNLQNRANAPAPASTQWITGISNTVVGIGAAAFAGLMFMKAMR